MDSFSAQTPREPELRKYVTDLDSRVCFLVGEALPPFLFA